MANRTASILLGDLVDVSVIIRCDSPSWSGSIAISGFRPVHFNMQRRTLAAGKLGLNVLPCAQDMRHIKSLTIDRIPVGRRGIICGRRNHLPLSFANFAISEGGRDFTRLGCRDVYRCEGGVCCELYMPFTDRGFSCRRAPNWVEAHVRVQAHITAGNQTSGEQSDKHSDCPADGSLFHGRTLRFSDRHLSLLTSIR